MSITEHYGDDRKLRNERLLQCDRAIRLRGRYERNREALMLAERYEKLEQRIALANYQKRRARLKLKINMDDFLYLI